MAFLLNKAEFLTDVDKNSWKLWTTEWKVVTRGIGFHLGWVWMHEFMSAINNFFGVFFHAGVTTFHRFSLANSEENRVMIIEWW